MNVSELERCQLQLNELRKQLAEANALLDLAMGKVQLSRREQQVLKLLADGMTTKEVALSMGLGYKTIDCYRMALMQKFRVHDVVRLTRCALRLGYAKL